MTDKQVISGLILNWLFHAIREPKNEKEFYYVDMIMNKIQNALDKEIRKDARHFLRLSTFADKAKEKSWNEFTSKTEILMGKVAFVMLNKYPHYFEPFKINMKHIKALNLLNGVGQVDNSLKVANSIMNKIKELE